MELIIPSQYKYPMEDNIATFAAGCFWGIESAFRKIKGVISTRVGYTGGHVENPTYKEVCSNKTGHAEAVEVIFDTELITYEELLDLFWNIHDPTTPNRQGWDIGSQYRSVIFYHNNYQKNSALKSKQKLEDAGKYKSPIVTEIVEASKFWQAEDYHQQYNNKKKRSFLCHF